MPYGRRGYLVRTGDAITNRIKFVEQRRLGCFNACLSMLTGIDNELFSNNVTFQMLPNSRIAGIREMKRIFGAEHHVYRNRGAESLRAPWKQVVKHYLNYGIKLHFHNKKPHKPSIRAFIWKDDNTKGHAVLELPNGELWCPTSGYMGTNPNYSWGMRPLDLWITAEQVG